MELFTSKLNKLVSKRLLIVSNYLRLCSHYTGYLLRWHGDAENTALTRAVFSELSCAVSNLHISDSFLCHSCQGRPHLCAHSCMLASPEGPKGKALSPRRPALKVDRHLIIRDGVNIAFSMTL